MEGVKYVATAALSNTKWKRGGPPPPTFVADLDAMPEHQAGVIPRAVDDLFSAISRESTSKRFSIK